MTADLINLRRERKHRERATEAAEAAANRAAAGLGKRQKRHAAAERTLVDRRLAGHRIEPVIPSGDD